MAINGSQNFTYEGYTLGSSLPTLYFAEGRYTQIHPQTDNIGWHPIRSGSKYRMANILKEAYDKYDELRSAKNEDGKNAFKAAFLQGKFDADIKDSTSLLFECSSNDNGLSWQGHPSRGRFISIHDPSFDPTYNETYAKGVLSNGVIAPNEH